MTANRDKGSAIKKREADLARLASISEIALATEYYLLNEYSADYFTVDTVFLSSAGIPAMWKWLDKEMRPLLEVTQIVSDETDPHRFHRLMLVPTPSEIQNHWDRRSYRMLVNSMLHFHLWYGVVCYVLFINKSQYEYSRLITALDFGAINKTLTFDTARFYEEEFEGMRPIEGGNAEAHIRSTLSLLDEEDLKNACMMYYDPLTFKKARRTQDALWRRTRGYLYDLFDGRCQGPPDCELRGTRIELGDAHVDHILPQGDSNNVLLNLRLLCGRCNKEKGSSDTREMPFELSFAAIPSELATTEVQNIMTDEPPSWIRRYKRPPKNQLGTMLKLL